MKPPVPGVEASTKLSDDTHSAFPVVSRTWSRDTPRSRGRSGSTRTCSCRSRWPQIATLATPGTPSRRGPIVHLASTDIWIRDRDFEDSPMSMTRLVDDRGWSIVGGFDTWGNANAWVRRSDTIWRARMRSVPGWNSRTIDDSPGSDSEPIDCSHGTPFNR